MRSRVIGNAPRLVLFLIHKGDEKTLAVERRRLHGIAHIAMYTLEQVCHLFVVLQSLAPCADVLLLLCIWSKPDLLSLQ